MTDTIMAEETIFKAELDAIRAEQDRRNQELANLKNYIEKSVYDPHVREAMLMLLRFLARQ